MKRLNKKGFTLAELLVVVAIIAVLVAISIPIFTGQLEKAREATDQANLRSAYAEVVSSALTETPSSSNVQTDGKGNYTATVEASQTKEGWTGGASVDIGGVDVAAKTSGNSWTVKYNASTNEVTFE